jgi:hypothetical protein
VANDTETLRSVGLLLDNLTFREPQQRSNFMTCFDVATKLMNTLQPLVSCTGTDVPRGCNLLRADVVGRDKNSLSFSTYNEE